jgi:hypothetical protein
LPGKLSGKESEKFENKNPEGDDSYIIPSGFIFIVLV